MTGMNTPSGEKLRGFLERVERIREDKKALGKDESAVFAEAKKAMGLMNVDIQSRESLIGAFRKFVPESGGVILQFKDGAVRLWRDDQGEVHAQDWQEPVAASAASPRGQKTEDRRPPPPDCDADGAEALGRAAAKNNEPVIANPFPHDDARRPRWDEGWRKEAGSDGMGPSEDDDE